MNAQLDPERARALLTEATSTVFAEMAFIDAGLAPERAAPDGAARTAIEGDTRCAVIDAMAPLSCRLELRVPAAIHNRIVDSLFSECPEAERKKNAEDSLLEMLNVIAGNFLSGYFGADTELQLSLPRYLYLDEPAQGTVVTRLRLDAEGTPFEMALYSVRYRY